MSGYGHEVQIDGVTYPAAQEQYGRRFLDVVRQQGGAQDEPSEFSLNPNDLWRRSQTDWVFGEGQLWYDDPDSVRNRYRIGTGVDPFDTEGEIKLGPGFGLEDVAGGGDQYVKLELADDFLWIMKDAETTLDRWNGTSITTTGTVPQDIVDIATDGANIYIACRNAGKTLGGVYIIEAGSTTPALLNTVIPDSIAYVMGRLMVSAGSDIYNITDVGSTTPPDPLTSDPVNSTFVWDTFGYADNFILAAGHAGDLSLIYRITIREDGTALTPPVQAGQLPDGEICYALKPYLGIVAIGTSRGIRIGEMQGGELQYGRLFEETTVPVEAIEPQGRFIYYGIDGAIHRADLSRFLPAEPLVPAHASYLDFGTSEVATGIHMYNDVMHFVVLSYLVSVNEAQYSTDDGEFWSGRIWYRMADKKQFYFLDCVARCPDADDTITVKYQLDGGALTTLGTLTNDTPATQFQINARGEWIEFKFELAKGAVTSTPVLERFTLRSMPQPKRTRQVQVALDMRQKTVDGYGAPDLRDVQTELQALEQLVIDGTAVTYKEFDTEYTVTLENVQLGPELDVSDHQWWEGMVMVTMRIYT